MSSPNSKNNLNKEKEGRYLSFLLMARLKLFEKVRRGVEQEFSLKARKALAEYHYQMELIKAEIKEEREALEKLKEELEKEIKNELGQRYSLLDVCPHSGRVLRNKNERNPE